MGDLKCMAVWVMMNICHDVGGNVRWCSLCGRQFGGSSEKEKQNYHMIRQSHSWACIWRKPWFQKIDAPQCSTIYKDMEVTYMSIDR